MSKMRRQENIKPYKGDVTVHLKSGRIFYPNRLRELFWKLTGKNRELTVEEGRSFAKKSNVSYELIISFNLGEFRNQPSKEYLERIYAARCSKMRYMNIAELFEAAGWIKDGKRTKRDEERAKRRREELAKDPKFFHLCLEEKKEENIMDEVTKKVTKGKEKVSLPFVTAKQSQKRAMYAGCLLNSLSKDVLINHDPIFDLSIEDDEEWECLFDFSKNDENPNDVFLKHIGMIFSKMDMDIRKNICIVTDNPSLLSVKVSKTMKKNFGGKLYLVLLEKDIYGIGKMIPVEELETA